MFQLMDENYRQRQNNRLTNIRIHYEKHAQAIKPTQTHNFREIEKPKQRLI